MLFSAPFPHRFKRILVGLLPTAIAACYLCYVVSVIADDSAVTNTEQTSPVVVEVAQPVAAPDYLQISEWHLFGQLQTAVEQATITETRLQLKLLGTFVSSTTPMSAVIQAEDGTQKKYKIGDALPGGAVLEDIAASRVLLSHNGRRESLALQRQNAQLAVNAE